jgi:tRNA G18 (ribose-2'-O)-methylase SpoU
MGFRKLENEELLRMDVDGFKKSEKIPVVVVLDNIRSLNNIGSVFRTSDAFRIEKIWLCGITATPPNREIHKTALGAENSVDWEYAENTLDALASLKSHNYKLYAVEQAENSISLETFTLAPDEKYAFIFGNEIKGVQQEVVDASDGCIEIPQFGTKHSFNISVTVGIVLWQIFPPLIKKIVRE